MYKNIKQLLFIVISEIIISVVTALCISLITEMTTKIFFATLLISAAVCAVIDIFLPVKKIFANFKQIILAALIFTLIFVPVTTLASSITACQIHNSELDSQVEYLDKQSDIYKKQLKTKHLAKKSKNSLNNAINGTGIKRTSLQKEYSSLGKTFGIGVAVDFVCGMIVFISGVAVIKKIDKPEITISMTEKTE